MRATADAFATGGYLGVNLNDVVVSLGLTKGALYHSFPTKESLAVEIVERHFKQWNPLVVAVEAEMPNRLDALIELTYRVADTYEQDPIARAGHRLSLERNLIAADLPAPYTYWLATINQMLRESQRAGEIRASIRPSAVANVIMAFFYGALRISIDVADCHDLRPRLDAFWKLLLPGLRPT